MRTSAVKPTRLLCRLAVGIMALIELVGCASGASNGALLGAPGSQPGAASKAQPGSAGQPIGRLSGQVSGKGAYAHLQALQGIADRNNEVRAVGTPGYAQSVDYVARTLQAAGYQVSTSPSFEVKRNGDAGDERVVMTRNVVAQTRTGNPERVVMLGGHLDSVLAGPGIVDNGSGVASLLEVATRLGGSPAVHNAVRFAFWGAEEDNDQGSLHYVKNLSDSDRGHILLYINVDMMASTNAGYFYQGRSGDHESKAGPPGSALVGSVLSDQLVKAGAADPENDDFSGDSDYEGFVKAGIPSGGLLTGDTDEMSKKQAKKWNGQAGVKYDACYHSACDRLDTVNRVALNRTSHAIAGTLDYFAMFDHSLTR